jgi:DNA-binding protein WhiA
MSFTNEVKKEINNTGYNRSCCDMATLATLYAFLSEKNRDKITLKTESASIARKIIILTKKYLGFDPEFIYNKEAKKVIKIVISDKENIDTVKNKLHLVSDKFDMFYSCISPKFVLDECCKKTVLKNAFLVGGFINSPKKSYHLEISTHKKRVFTDIVDILFEVGIDVKTTKRQNKYVLYIKNNEDISDFLSLIGAKRALFKFVDAKLEKEIKNDINRQLNCESSNENKAINASLIQTRAINKIIKAGYLDKLTEPLKKTCELRLKYPTTPLSELVMCSEAKITKSGLNHRLNKLIEISEKL